MTEILPSFSAVSDAGVLASGTPLSSPAFCCATEYVMPFPDIHTMSSILFFLSCTLLYMSNPFSLSTYLCVYLLISGVDKLLDPLRATVNSRVKANSVKQEFEKQDEMKRSAMRAVAALLAIPDAGQPLRENNPRELVSVKYPETRIITCFSAQSIHTVRV